MSAYTAGNSVVSSFNCHCHRGLCLDFGPVQFAGTAKKGKGPYPSMLPGAKSRKSKVFKCSFRCQLHLWLHS